MAGPGARRVRRSEKQWVEIVRRYEASGLGARAFCRREKVSLSSFQRWRPRVGLGVRSRFVELVPAPPETARETSGSWSLELSLPNGVSLRWRG